jgi:hypothetical protein
MPRQQMNADTAYRRLNMFAHVEIAVLTPVVGNRVSRLETV